MEESLNLAGKKWWVENKFQNKITLPDINFIRFHIPDGISNKLDLILIDAQQTDADPTQEG